jgi:hypothetical protein
MSYKKSCGNCDKSMNRGWITTTCKSSGQCFKNGYPDFILRRDKRNCGNCGNYNTTTEQCRVSAGTTCEYSIHEGNDISIWKPKTEEKPMYKPTNSCTLKKIAQEAKKDTCGEVKKLFTELVCMYILDGKTDMHSDWNRDHVYPKECNIFKWLTDSEEKCAWLSNRGIIEEDVKIKPCPFCNSEANLDQINHSPHYRVICKSEGCYCREVDHYHWDTAEKAIRAWNTRK